MKKFECKHHPNEQIQRICSELDCENTLCCIECILTTHGTDHKSSLASIKDFIDQISKHYEILRRIKSNEDAPPQEFTDFLATENEILEKLSHHLEKEKSIVNQAITELLESFTILCHITKEDLIRTLDAQLTNLKANYKYYNTKLSKFYNKFDEDDSNLSKEEIVAKINKVFSTSEFEFMIKNVKDDMAHFKIGEVGIDKKTLVIKEALQEMTLNLKHQASVFPKTTFIVESDIDNLMNEFKEQSVNFFQQNFNLNNAIHEFNMSNILIDSKIIEGDDTKLLKKWISNGIVKFKLLFRGSRDGFTSNAFHKNIGDIKPTIVIAQSNHNKIFGGFTDTDWIPTMKYKNSTGAFIFSISDKEKYPLKLKQRHCAIFANSSNLVTFGGGFDFYLCDNCNSVNDSYSNFGHSYDAKGKTKESLVGGYNFKTKEVEVFQVEYTGKLIGCKKKK